MVYVDIRNTQILFRYMVKSLYNAKEHGSRATPYVAFCLTRVTCKPADLMALCLTINYKNTKIIDLEPKVLDQ